MPKKIKYESFIYRFLMEAIKEVKDKNTEIDKDFIDNLDFFYKDKKIVISLKSMPDKNISYDLSEPIFYLRGDTKRAIDKQEQEDLIKQLDIIKEGNESKFNKILWETYNQLIKRL